MGVNNCSTCDYKRHPDGGHCYMFREEPEGVCMQHTMRRVSAADLIGHNFYIPSNMVDDLLDDDDRLY